MYKKALNIYDSKTPEPSALLFCSIIEGFGQFGKPRKQGVAKKRFVEAVIDAFALPDGFYVLTAVRDAALSRCSKSINELGKMSDGGYKKFVDETKNITRELLEDVYERYRCGFTHRMEQLSPNVKIMSTIGMRTTVVHSGSTIKLVMTINDLAEITMIIMRHFVKKRITN